jgi:hypothetical protein
LVMIGNKLPDLSKAGAFARMRAAPLGQYMGIRASKRDSAHVPYREADCVAFRHSYGGSGKRWRV